MQGIKNMLLGITIMIASIAFYSVYDNDTIAVIIAIIGLCVSIYGYSKRERDSLRFMKALTVAHNRVIHYGL